MAQPPEATSGSSSGPTERQSLSLRVLCLSKPTFRVGTPLISEPGEIAEDLVLTHAGDFAEGWEFGLGDLMLVPSTVPTIFLGETFSVYLSVHNHSPFDVASVSIKAELQLQQTKAPRIPLLDVPSSQIPSFPAGDSNDFILHHNMQVEGIYILVCLINYQRHDGEKKQFKKFFRFPVENPLVLKNKMHCLGDRLFIESQITNATKGAFFLSKASIVFTDGRPPLQPLPFERKEESEWQGFYLKATHSIQLLFEVEKPKVSTADSIGHLQVEWCSALGDIGRINSEPLRLKPTPKAGIHMYFSDVPDRIVLEEPFQITCNIINQSSTDDVNLVLYLIHQKMTGVIISGLSGRVLGRIPPLGSQSFPVTLFPTKPGVQKVTGLRFFDTLTEKRFDFDTTTPPLQVFVSL